MDRICRTCKHWKESEPSYSNKVRNAGRCDRIPMGNTRMVGDDTFDTVLIDDDTDEIIPATGAAACDGSGYLAYLMTGPEFGCGLHEANDAHPTAHP